MTHYPHLLTPLHLRGLTLKNRMFSAPTSMAELGPGEHYSKENLDYYRLKAAGGAALVTLGDVIVDLDTGRSHPQQVGINDPAARPSLVAAVEAIHAGGAAASIELDHGGALCASVFLGGKHPIGPSAYVDEWGEQVEEMTHAQMEQVADAFARGARTAKEYGFDMVMIHMGHGWLLHQFLSPLTNFRTDEYGGSLENRLRFPLSVLRRVREAVGQDFPIEVRISGSERTEGGYGSEEGIEIAKAVDGLVDLIHVSAGTQQVEYSAVLMHPGVFQKHGENAFLAEEIKRHVKTPVVTVGAFSDPDKMEAFLAAGHADAVAMGRALIADPFLPRKVMEGRVEEIRPCLRCGECQSGMMKNGLMRCAVNPLIGRENDFFHPIPTRRRRTVLIAGGGPAGCQAVLEARKRGHRVILVEKSERLGGLAYADSADFKSNLARYRDWLAGKVLRCGADIRLHSTVTPELVEELRPDALIIAIGAKPWLPDIPRDREMPLVYGAELREDTPVGERVVVLGGGLVGSEEAVALARRGCRVTLLEMGGDIAADCGRMHRLNLIHQVKTEGNLKVLTAHTVTRIARDGVFAQNGTGEESFFPADTVVAALGMRPDRAEVDRLRALVPEHYVVGDAKRARQIGQATREGTQAVITLGL